MASDPLPLVPGVVRVALEGTSSRRNWANIFHCQYTGVPPTVGAMTALLDSVGAGIAALLQPLMDNDTTIVQAVGTDLSSLSGTQIASRIDLPGTRTGATLPASVAALINYNSSFRYRGGHPRSYFLVGVDTDILDQSTWTAGFVAELGGLADSIGPSFAAGTSGGTTFTNQCAVSYRTAGARRVAPPYVIMPIATATASNGMASQRRRMRRG